MQTPDILRMAVHNLWQRRIRTFFNLTGIVTGCIVLLMTAAGTTGVRNAIHALFDSTDFARQIYIFPRGRAWQEPPEDELVIDALVSDSRRKRIRKALIQQWNHERRMGSPRHELTTDDLDSIRKISHVQDVIADSITECIIKMDEPSLSTGIAPFNTHSRSLRNRLLAGTLPEINDREGVLIDEFLAWKLGFRNDADLPKLLGKQLNIEYQVAQRRIANIYNHLMERWGEMDVDEMQKQTKFLQTLSQLMGDLNKTTLADEQKSQLRELLGSGLARADGDPKVTIVRQYVVRGVVQTEDDDPIASLFRQWFHHVEKGLLVTPDTARELHQSQNGASSFHAALVVVDRSSSLDEVIKALQKDNYRPQSALTALENINQQIDNSAWIIYGVAITILLTSAVGIVNTLTMSIAERTSEFGIMKAIGARDSHVLKLMIAEGAILGLIGAVVAILLSVLLGILGQSLFKMYVESRTQTEIAGKLFQFQTLPALLVLLISTALCIIASLIPAWRAAKLDPVVAMRRN